ncbi:spermidine/putrescine ABC transporter ATP-binding protein [Alkalibaculum sp. M08DMB]|uniref:Spermidine/putrescine ABC transporter ATP-binding protein n=1 Tax=Alkalibaculum sporogenes TaxID=2655001 RepID=A0A6A7KCM8_9FIRM|nr:spermidine/putrescine ABC transporter ATP-binding protein [Alkalibaculum sporogenes]
MFVFYPALTGTKTPASRFKDDKKLSGRLSACKSRIGSTNIQ